jgi:hypothetical protein
MIRETPRSNAVHYDTTPDEMKAHPGEWCVAVLRASYYNVASNIKLGRAAGFGPAGAFESTARSNGDGTWKVYAKYVGNN